MSKLTTDRKLVIDDTVYVFRVPSDTSIDPMEIIRKGRILMIKKGAMNAVDANGNVMGMAARSWNPLKPLLVELTGEINDLLKKAIHRTHNLIAADQKVPEGKLPRLFSGKFQTKVIERDDSVPRYFIRTSVYCANCKEPIAGTQTIHPNSNGYVGSADPFVADNGVPVPNSRKWLHPECATTAVEPEQPEENKGVENKGVENKRTIAETTSTLDTLLGILKDPVINSEFARGCAYMYLLTHKED